jgi:serine/threonine protein kinase/Tfp pilus assembly protein PilF
MLAGQKSNNDTQNRHEKPMDLKAHLALKRLESASDCPRLNAVAERRISHYRAIRQIGRGGMGEVFLAKDTRLERLVAIKLMSLDLARDPNQRQRFQTEAKAASGLNHPNICVVYEVGESEDGRPFLAMEYIDGRTLEFLMRQRRIKIRESIEIGIQLADALEAAHARHLLHRDIKPGNIMLDKRGNVKLLDFGLAKRFRSESLAHASTDLSHTDTGITIGTPHYMSPEQALGRELDDRSDIFNLGIVLYELVAGQRPFRGATTGETINSIINVPPEPLGLENPLFSPALDNIVAKCLAKAPEERYASAKALADELRTLKVESRRARRATDSSVVVPVKFKPDQEEGTKLWQLASKVNCGPTFSIAAAVAVAALLAFVVWLLIPKENRARGVASQSNADTPPPPQKSIAVLPFDNFSGEADTDYLSDGLTEEITAALSRVPGLKVAARNSAFTFKGKKEDIRKIGETLHVSKLLEGSVRKSGKQIRVTAQLINAADGYHLWSESYDRDVEDIIPVEEDIARRIADRLQGQTNTVIAKRQAVDPEAYKLYLQGRQYWNKRTETALKKSVQLYQEAIDTDPTYALAHAGLAAAYLLIPGYSHTAKPSAYNPLARAAANRALELDPACPEAHAVLGNMKADARDFKGAEEHYRQAIASDPNYATAHHWYGRYLYCRGQMDDGLKELRTALELDPLSPIIHATIPAWNLAAGNYDQTITEVRNVIDQFPDFVHVRAILAEALMLKGQYKEGLAEIDKARALIPDEPSTLIEYRAYALARMGREAEAREILRVLQERLKEGKPAEVAISMVYIGLHEYDKALDVLERLNASEGLDLEIFVDPCVKELRNLPRFQALLEKAGMKADRKA